MGRNRYREKRRRGKIRQKNSGDESKEEKSGPRFAGCDGGAKSGLSHVDLRVKATIQSADEIKRGEKRNCR